MTYPFLISRSFRVAEGFGKQRVSRFDSAGRALPVRGKQGVSSLRWNASVYSSVSTRQNPDFDEQHQSPGAVIRGRSRKNVSL